MPSAAAFRFTLVHVGRLDRVEVGNALSLANAIQPSFRFETLHPDVVDVSAHMLANGAVDLDGALLSFLAQRSLSRPILALSSEPYGDKFSSGANQRFFVNYSVDGTPSVALISTELWTSLGGTRALQPYLLYCLAGVAFCQISDVCVHADAPGCVMSYCADPAGFDQCLAAATLCADCEREVSRALRLGRATNAAVASARRILNRAAGLKSAFVATPFRRELRPVAQTVTNALRALGWTVMTGDDVVRPRRITDAIVQAILAADLVVADITGQNANVFYEVGLAHAFGTDVLMLTQDQRIPFDVSTERAVRYTASTRGLRRLTDELARVAGAPRG